MVGAEEREPDKDQEKAKKRWALAILQLPIFNRQNMHQAALRSGEADKQVEILEKEELVEGRQQNSNGKKGESEIIQNMPRFRLLVHPEGIVLIVVVVT